MGGGRRRSGGKAQPQGPGGCRGGGQGLGRTAPRPRLRRRGQAGAGPARPPGTPRAAARAGARDGADDAAILTMWGSVLAFALVAALLTITPGIDTALVIRNTLQGGRATGLRTSLGICTGLIVWGLLSALGVTAVVTASRVAYDVLRFAGAAYLVFLGVRTLLVARRDAAPVGAPAIASRRSRAAFRTGMLNNLLNPKVGVFYVTLLPQFIPAGASVLGMSVLLAGVHFVEGVIWLSLLTLVVHRASRVMRRAAVRRTLERLTGLVLIGFGARVALERV